MTNSAPQHPIPSTSPQPSVADLLTAAELNLRGIYIHDANVVLVDGELPVAVLELGLEGDRLLVDVELPTNEREQFTRGRKLEALSVVRVDDAGRPLLTYVEMQRAVGVWCENERTVREAIESAWDRAERWELEAAKSAEAWG